MIIVLSEIFNPYLFMLGIERPDVKLFMSIPEVVALHREILMPRYPRVLDGVIELLSRAAPLTDLYLYLRDHPLQNPAKAKVHCEHGFGSLRLAVKTYLDVSFYQLSPLISVFDLLSMTQEMQTSCSESCSKVILSHPEKSILR